MSLEYFTFMADSASLNAFCGFVYILVYKRTANDRGSLVEDS